MVNSYESSDLLLDEVDTEDTALDDLDELGGGEDDENLDDSTAGWSGEEKE